MGYELQEDPGGAWTDAGKSTPPIARGTRLNAHYRREGGFSTLNTNVVTGGGVKFGADGSFAASESIGFGGNYGAASVIGSGDHQGLYGRYELDGYFLKITSPEGAVAYRYFYLSGDYIQFEGQLYWQH